jgi:hypothetical protein
VVIRPHLKGPKTGHRMAAKGMESPWQWTSGTISTNLDLIWGMSAKRSEKLRHEKSGE